MKAVYEIERTNKNDIEAYKYLLIDLDPRQKRSDSSFTKRPKGVSSTDEEHEAAITLASHIISEMGIRDENYLLIDSGNGAHVYLAIDSGTQERSIVAGLQGIKTLYETEEVEVDSQVSNESRLMRAPGSINCKGAIRRPCKYLHCPEMIIPLDYEFVANLAVDVVNETPTKDGADLAEQIAEELGYHHKKGNTLYLLKKCPFCQHTDKAAVVGRVGSDGGYFFKCHHASCTAKKWPELKELMGIAAGRVERLKKVIKEQGLAALEITEVQEELSKIKATGELGKLEQVAREAGIELKALKAAAKKPYAIAQDYADGWIREYYIKTDRLTGEIFCYQDGVYGNAECFLSGLIDRQFRGINTTSFINNVLDYIRRQSEYDFSDEWLALENGLLNPVTLEIVGFSPELVTRIKLKVTHDPKAKCPKWRKFLDECQSNNPTLLQQAAGYPLLGNYPHQKAIMLLGNGGQGKGVFLSVIREILGTGNVSASTLQTLIENRFATAGLYGKLANISGDVNDVMLSDSGIFKALTGDDLIRAENKGKPEFNFLNRAKLLFSANALPPTKDKSTGYFRRWVLIDFKREMVQHPNTHLLAELLEERAGIFNWMLEGAKMVRENGFSYENDPEKMAAAYIGRSEPVVKFLEECYIEDFDKHEPSAEVFSTYNAWARENKMKRLSSKGFVNAMKNQTIFSLEYTRLGSLDDNGNRPMVFIGIQSKAKFKRQQEEAARWKAEEEKVEARAAALKERPVRISDFAKKPLIAIS